MSNSRRNLLEREKLVARVERNVLRGLDTPGVLFEAMPELGSRRTARTYLQAVQGRWEELSRPDTLEKARYALIGNAIRMREIAWQNAQECESHTARVQFLRLVDKAIEREEKLRGLAAVPPSRLAPPPEAVGDDDLDAALDRIDRDLGLNGAD